jgi:hypothetical protein
MTFFNILLVPCPANNSLDSPRLLASGGVAAARNSWLTRRRALPVAIFRSRIKQVIQVI